MTKYNRIVPSIPVFTGDPDMSIMVPSRVLNRNPEFFNGYSGARGRISREDTYKEVDAMTGVSMSEQLTRIGRLFGLVRSYQAYIYLCQVFGDVISIEILDILRPKYV